MPKKTRGMLDAEEKSTQEKNVFSPTTREEGAEQPIKKVTYEENAKNKGEKQKENPSHHFGMKNCEVALSSP